MLNRTIGKLCALRKLNARLYNEKVIEYFENPPNVGSLDKKNPNVGTGKVIRNRRLCRLWRPLEVPGSGRR